MRYIDIGPGGVLPADTGQSQTFLLAEYWGIAWKHKWLILLLAFAGAVVGFALFLRSMPVYQAWTTLELQGFNETFMNMHQVDLQAGTGIYSAGGVNLATQIRIIDSYSVKTPVLERLERETTPVLPPQADIFGKMRRAIGIAPQDPLAAMRRGLQMAVSTLQVRAVPGTRIISITCDSTTPEIAANFVNALAAEYAAQNIQWRSSSAQRTIQWLESQLEETKSKLAQSEQRLQEFVRKSGPQFASEQDTLAGSRLRQLQQELAAIQTERIAKQTLYEMAKASPPEALPGVLQDGTLSSFQQSITALRTQRAQLLTTLTPAHYKVQRIDAQIEELQSAYDRAGDSLMQRIRNEYETAARRERTLAAEHSRQSQAVISQADKAAEYGLLKREVEILRLYLNGLLQQVNQAGVVSAVPTSNVRVVDGARPPSFPYKPNPFKYSGYGLSLGLVFGAAVAVGYEKYRKMRADRKLAQPGLASTLLNVPELGVIPSADYNPKAKKLYRMFRRKPAVESTLAGELESQPRGMLRWHQDAPSMLADSFQLVLTSITLMEQEGHRPRVILVTSPGPGEGKTTIASNLALAMAEGGSRVLVIDADFRRPRLHQVFNLENRRGFSNLVADAGLAAAPTLQELIQPTAAPGLYLLSSGTAPAGSAVSQLRDARHLTELFAALRHEFHTILIDTPPMLQFSEARLLGRMADGVILVLRAGATDRNTALASRQRLAEDRIPLLGTVLNDWNPKESGEYFYTHYYNNYYARRQDS